jgi:hypothetical protein
MKQIFWLVGIGAGILSCMSSEEETRPSHASAFTVTIEPFATVNLIGPDTLSDSALILELHPEPDEGSVAFRFADPVKHITSALGIVQASGNRQAQLVWPDSVLSVWWGNPHELGFIAGIGTGVRVVVDVHATQLEAIEASEAKPRLSATLQTPASRSSAAAVKRAQTFIDSVRVQPEGTPQHSTLHYEADTAAVAPDTALAAVHVSARDHQGTKSNPSWYLVHIPSGHVRPVDSLTGSSPGLPATGGKWSNEGVFYYAKERSILRVRPQVH